jgi:hypothetical protein
MFLDQDLKWPQHFSISERLTTTLNPKSVTLFIQQKKCAFRLYPLNNKGSNASKKNQKNNSKNKNNYAFGNSSNNEHPLGNTRHCFADHQFGGRR